MGQRKERQTETPEQTKDFQERQGAYSMLS